MNYDKCLNCWGDGRIEVHSPEGDYIKSCPECGGTGKRRITIQLQKFQKYDMLKAELARYKQEAEKIPDICLQKPCYFDLMNDGERDKEFVFAIAKQMCPQICPKWREGGKEVE